MSSDNILNCSRYRPFVDYVNQLCLGHFLPPTNDEDRNKILSSSIRVVELELSSFCNRKCHFCPNSFIDRFNNKYFMDNDAYENIITQLSLFNYKGVIGFARYSEPLADKGILSKIAYAKKKIPNARILVITNGDYLNIDYVNAMEEAGLDEVRVSIYLKDNQDFTEDNVIGCIDKIEHKIGRKLDFTHRYDGKFVEKKEREGGKLPRFSILAQNFDIRGTNRGGLIVKKTITSRTSPCHQPFTNITIDYNGNVVPCCNIRSDSQNHKNYILGNIYVDTLSDIYFSEKFISWRRELCHFSNKKYPCNGCSMSEYVDDIVTRKYLDEIISRNYLY